MRGLRVALKDAEKAKRFLKERGLIVQSAFAVREGNWFYLPVTGPLPKLPFAALKCERDFEVSERKPFKQLLLERKILSQAQVQELVTSFDLVGDIAVIDVPPSLRIKEKLIAACLLESLGPRVKVVAKRAGITEGRFRVRKVKVLTGERRTRSIHKENGVLLEVDLNESYFSPRLGFERQRVASLVKPNERVLVLFAGVGPFAIEIAKRVPTAQVVAVELNPAAVKSMRKNVRLNRASNVKVVLADAAVFLKRKAVASWADRVLLPLPKTAKRFLPAAIAACRPGGTVHYYSIGPEDGDFLETARKDAQKACAKARRNCEIVGGRRVKPYAPYVTQAVLDFVVR
jgi:tRNA (guanine37-N1)-methyltransferase